MCFKENRLCLFFIYTIAVISLPAGGWREAPPPKPSSHLSDEEGGRPPAFHRLRTEHGSQTEPSIGRGPEARPGERTDPSLDPAQEDCGRAELQRVVHGTFYVTAQLDTRSDPGSIRDQQSWRRLQPVVECGDNAMTLTVRRRHAEQLQLDRVNASSVPLSRLPPPCGYSVQTTATHLRLRVRYDGCHVTQQDDHHMLPLLWRGSSVTASCPVAGTRPVDAGLSALCCSSGFAVAVQGPSAEELRVNVRGHPTPVGLLAERCGFAVERRRADVVVTAPFAACGVSVKDGKHTLSLQRAEDVFTLSCPISPAHRLLKVQAPVIRLSPHGSRGLRTLPQSSEPLSWAPPFYLAPLYYPHPTHHYYPEPHAQVAPPPPDPAFDPQPLPDSRYPPQTNEHLGLHRSATDESKDLSRIYPGLERRPEPPGLRATAWSFLTEAPFLQHPSQAFNPYYHYYHHPKIPRTGPPYTPDRDLDAAQQLPPASSQNPDIPVRVQESDAASDQLPHLELQTLPTSPEFDPNPPEPRVSHPSPPRFHHLPYFASSGTVAPVRPDLAAKTNASRVFPFPPEDHVKLHVHHLHDTRNAKKRQLIPEDDVTAALDDGSRSASPSSQSSGLQPHPHSYYFYPFYLQGPAVTEHRPPPESTHRTTGPTNPYYYHYLHPEAAADHQDMDSGNAGFPQTMNSPVHSFSPYYASLPRPHGPSVHPSENKDRLEPNAPSAPPCVSGPVSHLDCARSLGCCSYHVHDCTLGQHLVLVLPDCLLSPALVAPARRSEVNASCSLQKLTSDPGVYAVPLVGCGVAKHVFGDTVVYLVELHGFQAHPLGYASPVRLMLECRSSPGSPGEVRLRVLDQLPPALVTVQLRVASDPSFSRYHPEAHLPLSRLRGRPLYLEVSLLDPPDPDLVLLVHSCLAHTLFFSWMPIYDGCSSRADSQLLPALPLIRRISVSSFMSLPPESPPDPTGGSSPLDDPEIYFLCLTEVCSSSDRDCTISCGNGPNSEQ